MGHLMRLTFVAVLISQAYTAPQFITFDNGKLGVNFGGYHAAVGLGGLLGQNGGAGGGLFAEAGTPHGQSAKAGLGGAVDNGQSAGGLYASATAGGNVKAATGLAGGVLGEKSAGAGFAAAQAGNHYAASGMGGDTSSSGASGFTFSGTKSFGINKGQVDSSVVDIKPIQTEHKKVHKEFNFDAANEVNFVPLASDIGLQKDVAVKTDVKEVYVQSPPQVVEKHIVHKHNKPHQLFHNRFGFVDENTEVSGSAPAIQKRIDVGVDASVNAGAAAETSIGGSGNNAYTKKVTFQRNPNFFADIFNIPISTLKAVGNFLGNTAGSTSVSVQKSGSVQADSDLTSPKHADASSVSSSETHLSVKTPDVSKVIDDILAIPINTLGAVNKFLENNVPARKSVQVSEDGTVQPVRRLGPHARRRANKQVVIVQEESVQKTEQSS
ncbi:unnamed protein product [Diatraea saccharalis]|uniref:Uncharacterized protein n=1 Tax=Diatraea saccharalis TaxID=40085 RepID=A0A9N9R1T6_9NEOP|nr:unnamed protein product [Diatraea saccharalis]